MISHENIESKSKVGMIFREDESKWISCQSINANLLKAYGLKQEVDIFYAYSRSKTSYDIINEIIAKKISVLIFVDHQVRPLELLQSDRLLAYIEQAKVKVIFHVYGCFVDRIAEYYQIGKLLKHQDVHFVAASPRHKDLVSKTMQSQGNVHCVPFPVDSTLFKFNEEKRTAGRKALGVDEETSLFIYTGRISNLKNVELSMRLLSQEFKAGKKIKFLYVGEFDNFGTYQNYNFAGQTAQINAKLLKSLDPQNEWCHYHHFVSGEELVSLLNAADAFISLSVYPSDDFGVAVAEAQSCGLPCFLTDWGGPSGFKTLGSNTYAKISLAEAQNDLLIDFNFLQKEIRMFKNSTNEERVRIAEMFEMKFGLAQVASLLADVISAERNEFKGIDQRYVLRRQLAGNNNFEMIFELKDLYESYWV